MRTKASSFLLAYYPGTVQDLPVISPRAQKAALVASSRNLSRGELLDAFESDAFLTAKLISVANSIFFNHSHSFCFAIKEALDRVGMEYAGSLLTKSLTTTYAPQISDMEPLWLHSISTAIFARALAPGARNVAYCPNSVYSIALIHDIGFLIEMAFNIREAESVIELFSTRESENDNHLTLGAALAQYWSLPRLVRDVMAWHHHPTLEWPSEVAPLLGLLHLAHEIADGKSLESIRASLEFQTASSAAGLLDKQVKSVLSTRNKAISALRRDTWDA